MQLFALGRSFQHCEFEFATPGLIMYPDANTRFDVEANNDFTRLLTQTQLSVLFEVWFFTIHCNVILCQVFVVTRPLAIA